MPTVHPAAELFPMLSDEELADLAADIKARGQEDPCVIFGGRLLDGRNRWRACEIAGIEPKTTHYTGNDPVGYVISKNLKRRHLNESQRGIIGARALAMFEEDAKERIRAGGSSPRANLPASTPGRSREKAAEMVNVSPRTIEAGSKVLRQGTPELVQAVEKDDASISAAAEVAELPAEEQRQIVARGEKEILKAAKEIRAKKTEAKRQERVEHIREVSAGNQPLEAVQRVFPVILCDPPWSYQDSETRGAAEHHYPVMSLDEICALKVPATKDAVLFLWGTSPLMPDAFKVLAAWGFDYKSSAVWTKPRAGLGHWFRIRHEFVLLGVRGNMPPPAPSDRPDSVLTGPMGEHSAKPEELHTLVERMYPSLPKLEMFARGLVRPGWSGWGNQAQVIGGAR